MIAFGFGLLIGIGVGAYLAWERFLRYEHPTIVVGRELLSDITSQIVQAWLESRGLCWMPKGRDFERTIKR